MPRVDTSFNRGPITPRRRRPVVDVAPGVPSEVRAVPRYPNGRLDRMLVFRRTDPGIFAILTDETRHEVEQYRIDRETAGTCGSATRSMHDG